MKALLHLLLRVLAWGWIALVAVVLLFAFALQVAERPFLFLAALAAAGVLIWAAWYVVHDV